MLSAAVKTTCLLLVGMLFLDRSTIAAEMSVSNAQLAEKAKRLQAVIEGKMLQQHGMIPMLVRASDYRLPTAEDYRGAYRHRHLQGKTEAELGMPPMHEWRAWENTPSDTAYYLYAMAYQYRTTGDPKVLSICRRTLAALKYIYMLGVESGEPGFLCKPYGGIYSNQTSLDQVQCVAWGLAAYRPLAPPEDVADIDRMTRDFAQFLMRHEYYPPTGYFGRSAGVLRQERGSENLTWQRAIIVLPVLNLAWYGTGDDHFAKEIDRWYDACGDEKIPPLNKSRFTGKGYGDRSRNIYLSSQLMEMDPARYQQWRARMKSYYLQDRNGILEDGTWPTAWVFDRKAEKLKPQEFASVGGGYGRTGRSAIFAMACVSAQRWLPAEDMKGDARNILEGLDEDTFRFIMPLDEAHPLPPEWQVESKMLDGDSLTAWLSAYWEGRFRGYW
ncbi:MAG: hypothetical protein WD468_11640 [Pirellulales bacterium]